MPPKRFKYGTRKVFQGKHKQEIVDTDITSLSATRLKISDTYSAADDTDVSLDDAGEELDSHRSSTSNNGLRE